MNAGAAVDDWAGPAPEKNAAGSQSGSDSCARRRAGQSIELIEKLLTLPSNLFTMWDSCMRQADLKWRWVGSVAE